MQIEEFRAAAHDLVDWIADHRAAVAERPVAPATRPGEVTASLPGTAPERPEPFADVLDDLRTLIAPHLTETQHPMFFGWFPSNAAPASVLGDIASSGLAALGITWQSAPAQTELEEVVVEWLREATGLPAHWRGAIHDTASAAVLVALLAARERATDYSEARGGLQAEPAPLVVYTTAQAHSSVRKAALLAGFGAEHVRLVATDPVTHAMTPVALKTAIADDVAAGRRPAVVVLSLGSTGVTAFDPVPDLAPIARDAGAWVHVDAAMAGSALLLEEFSWMREGLDDVDSLGWNPHKWMGTILDCSLLYVADPEHLVRVMSTNPSYLASSADGQVTQFKDWGVPLGRRFRALKLWFHLRLDGLEAIRARLRRDLAHARRLAELVEAHPEWQVLAPVTLQTLCVRHVPPALARDIADGAADAQHALDAHTRAWAQSLNDSGAAFVTPATLDDHWMVRISIGALPTEAEHVEALWALLQEHTASAGA